MDKAAGRYGEKSGTVDGPTSARNKKEGASDQNWATVSATGSVSASINDDDDDDATRKKPGAQALVSGRIKNASGVATVPGNVTISSSGVRTTKRKNDNSDTRSGLRMAPAVHIEHEVEANSSTTAVKGASSLPTNRNVRQIQRNDEYFQSDVRDRENVEGVGAIAIEGTYGPDDDDEHDHHLQDIEASHEVVNTTEALVEDGDLAMAVPIDEDESDSEVNLEDTLPPEGIEIAKEVDDIESKTGDIGWIRSHKKISFTIALVVVVVIIVVAVVVAALDSDPATEAECAIDGLSRLESVADILVAQNVTDQEAFCDTSTPQYRALTWVADEDVADVEFSYDQDGDLAIQRYALAVIYFATGGSDWLDPVSFTSETPVCEWTNTTTGLGVVECDTDGFVTMLQLNDNLLDGTIPKELGSLNRLQFVDFSSNSQLSGPIPATIGNMNRIEVFHVESAGLTGSIPNSLGGATSLREFIVNENALNGTLPSSIGTLTRLEELFVNANRLIGAIPTEVGLLTNLVLLFVNDNILTGSIPSSVVELAFLRQANFSYNALSDGGNNLCSIENESLVVNSTLVVYSTDCFDQTFPAISEEIECTCCSTCCGEEVGRCRENTGGETRRA